VQGAQAQAPFTIASSAEIIATVPKLFAGFHHRVVTTLIAGIGAGFGPPP
jgi:hypothetical protein